MAEDSNSLCFDWSRLKRSLSPSNIHPHGASTIKRSCTSNRKLQTGSKERGAIAIFQRLPKERTEFIFPRKDLPQEQ
jgi:hypothetical protein